MSAQKRKNSAYLTLVDLTAYLGEGIIADCIEEEFLASSKLALVHPRIVVVFCAKLENRIKKCIQFGQNMQKSLNDQLTSFENFCMTVLQLLQVASVATPPKVGVGHSSTA